MKRKKTTEWKDLDFKSGEEYSYLLGLLDHFKNRYEAKADIYFSPLTWKQYYAICCLARCNRSMSLNELAGILSCSHQNARQIVRKLEAHNLIRVENDTVDKRKILLTVTEEGHEFRNSRGEGVRQVQGEIFSGITSSDIDATIRALHIMDDNVKEIEVSKAE